MPFTLNAPPGLNDLPDVALAAEEIAQGQHAAKILENTKFGTVRPEFFLMGRFRDGETVPLPKSKADDYQYQTSEVVFLWSPAITANPVNGRTSEPGAIFFMDMRVEQAADSSPGLVHTKVVYHVQGGHTEPSQDGELNVFAVGMRGSSVISLSAVPAWTDLADTAFDTDSVWRTDRLSQLNANAKRGIVQAELLDMGEFAHGQIVPAPVSPVDGHVYANTEIEWLPCWRWTPHFTTGITSGPTGATLSRIQVSVSAARVVSSTMTYRLGASSDTATNDGRIHVFAFCFRSGVALSGTVSFSDLDSSKFAGGKKTLEPDTLVLNRNAKFATVRPEFFVTTRTHGQTVALPTSPLDGYAYARAELRYFYIRQDTGAPSVIGSLLTLHGFIRQDTGVVTLNTFYLKSGSSPTQTNTNNGIYRVITVAVRSEDAVSDAGTPDPTGGEPGFGGGLDNDLVSGGGILLMRNPDFESGDQNWTKQTGFTIENDPANAYDGNWVGKFVGIAAAAMRNSIIFSCSPGNLVVAHCFIKRTVGDGGPRVRISWLDASKVEIRTTPGNAVTSSAYALSRVVATAPAATFFARVEALMLSATVSTTAFFDQFYASFSPIDLDDVGDSPTRLAPDPVYFDGSRRPNRLRRAAADITADETVIANESITRLGGRVLDNVADSTLRKAVRAVDVNQRPLIDFTQAAHLSKNLDNVADGTRAAFTSTTKRTNVEGLESGGTVAANKVIRVSVAVNTIEEAKLSAGAVAVSKLKTETVNRIWQSQTMRDAAVDVDGNLLLKNVKKSTATTSSPTTTSTSFVDLAEMTITVTTKGNPVLLVFTGTFSKANASVGWELRFMRDAAAIGISIIESEADQGAFVTASFGHLDEPVAGTYTYKIQWRTFSSAMTLKSSALRRELRLLEVG